jgi:flagellar secretion chaperone FliS
MAFGNAYGNPYGGSFGGASRQAYQNSDVETADRGKLLLMVYDHSIKWCSKAIDAINSNQIEARTKAIFKVQDGITELMCSLDFERGGEIANQLRNLYDFYNRHLSEANIKNDVKRVEEVQEMLISLRNAWDECILEVRRTGSVNLSASVNGGISIRG